uniref:Transmembrane protein 134 n=1 Tax=Arion vulgaris TaxID=1028688 RepID=A0A0B6YWS9_9EUPU
MMASDYWVNSGAQGEEPVVPYGSTSSNPVVAKIRNNDDTDIQLHDFKGVNFKEPLISETNTHIPSEKKCAVRPTSLHSLLSSPSNSDHHHRHSEFLETSFIQRQSWIRHPKVREHWKIILTSAFLSLLGIALMLTGIAIAITPSRGYHCLIFGIIGLLCIIPGGYHFVYIYCAALGRPGYEFENLPVLR